MARALIVAVALGAAVAWMGCGASGNESTGDQPSSDAISLQVFGDAEELGVYRELVDSYNAESEGPPAQLVEVPDREAHLAKLSASFAAGEPPDVFLINFRNLGPYIADEAIEPVAGLIEQGAGGRKGSQFDLDEFYPEALVPFTVDGELQCMPQNLSSLVVYYNRDAFEDAGVALPSQRWDWQEFTRAAARLTVDEDGDGAAERHGIGVEPSLMRASAFVWSAGGEIVDDTENPSGFTLTEARARDGLERLLSLRERGWSPSADEAVGLSLEERFANGSLAMLMSSRREVPSLRTITGFEWDVAAFPRIREPASVQHGDGFCLSAGQDAGRTFEFVRYAAGVPGQRVLASGGRVVPALRDLARSEAFLDDSKPPRSSQVFLDQIPHLRQPPGIVGWTQIEASVDAALEQAYYGAISLDDAFERIDAETATQFAAARP